ncbi:MAG: hypothetical protein JWQ84_2249 [Mucilaginibacter sp.]|nr:hypothetical protein [Mucilaginibacter sp.]MDB5017417.1 hypothetical protein [Mucilaginibacter sp.]MDB5138955.1 hypothetical protein [Mucilaginibacter sp.]
MGQELMIKAFGRSALITLILIFLFEALWHYTIITVIVLVFAWLFLMFYMDPPEDWD